MALVYPRFRYASGDPPLGLAYIAGYMRQHTGAEVRIVDGTWRSEQHLRQELEAWHPDMTGIYVNTLGLEAANRIARFASRFSFVVAGGPHATVQPETVVAGRVVQGEGELAVAQLVDDHPRIAESLDDLGHPAFDLVDMGRYTRAWHYLDHISPKLRGANIVASRGCPWNCTYCQPTLRALFGKKVRRHSPHWVGEEALRLKRLYAVDGLFFHDDTFTADREWALEVGERLKMLGLLWGANVRADTIDLDLMFKLHESGLRNIHLGVEAASDRVRNEIYGKHISTHDVWHACKCARTAGVAVMGFFMLGAPGETQEEMEATIELACQLPLAEATFSVTSLLPGTHLVARSESTTRDYYGSDAPANLRTLQRQALVRFYVQHWPYVAKHFLSITGIQRLIRKVVRFS